LVRPTFEGNTTMANKFSFLLGTSVVAASLIAANPASANVRVHFGGGVHVGGGVSVHWSRPAPVWQPAPRTWVSGSVYWGGSYSRDSYYPGGYSYPVYPTAVVPSYYPVTYGPSATQYQAPTTPPPQLSRFAIGVFAGGVSTQNDTQGDDLGILARVRLTPRLLLEGELGRSRMGDGSRVDRRVEGAAIYEFSPYSASSLYVLAGIGAQSLQVDDTWATQQRFAEGGLGLRWSLSRSIQLLGDVRLGQRQETDQAVARPTDVAARQVAPQANSPENYSRVRFAVALSF
jgi:hypothetical protein